MSDETIDPAKNKTLVGLRADMKFGKELVPIQGFVGEEFHLKLQKPAPIGSAMSVAYWLKDAFKVDSPGMKVVTLEGVDTGKDFAEIPKADLKTKIEKNLATQGVPPAAIEVLTSLLAARVEVNALSIDVIPEKKKEGDKKKINSNMLKRVKNKNAYLSILEKKLLVASRFKISVASGQT